MKEYWVENHFAMKGTIIAKVQKIHTEFHAQLGLPEIKILNLLYNTGEFDEWVDGTITTITKDDLKDEKETIKFVFEEVEYSK